MIYLVKSGKNTFEYEEICDKISLLVINTIIKSMNYPHLNSNDMQILRNSGGTVVYRTSDDIMIWLINIKHEQDIKIVTILSNELVDIVSNLRNAIKRDLILNKIL